MEALLDVRNLKTQFFTDKGIVRAVDGVSFSVKKGETLGIVGESGCGKSITAMSILGLIDKPGRITQGQILFEGRDLTSLGSDGLRQVRGNEISMIFQEPMTSLNPVFTIERQIAEPLVLHCGLSAREAKARAVELLTKVGVSRPERVAQGYPHQLSGGMRQRVMIAMALACGPKLLIADEPTTALDVTIQAQILYLMNGLREELETSILLITHDLGVVAQMADHVIVMYAGKVVESAPVRELFACPKHPYTRGLLASVPNLEERKKRLYTIEGMVPSPFALPDGCPFAPRCEHANHKEGEGAAVGGKCWARMPALTVEKKHGVRCYLYSAKAEETEKG